MRVRVLAQKIEEATGSSASLLVTPLLPCLYLALLDCTQLYYTVPWLYLALLDSTTLYHGSTLLYLTVLQSTMFLLGSS